MPHFRENRQTRGLPGWQNTLGGFVLAACLLLPVSPSVGAEAKSSPASLPSALPGFSMGMLDKLASSVTRTGVGRDKIAALYRPSFVTVSDANLSMENDEVVFIVTYPNGRTRIYPQRIMVWHEVVNDVLPEPEAPLGANPKEVAKKGPFSALARKTAELEGDSYTITYSPITGAVCAFQSLAGKYPSTFGVSGTLLNGNTVLYDRISGSLWSQLLAVSIEGPLKGKRLQRIPVLWATWKGVKEQYLGKAEVLSRSTGYTRMYGKDPYGSYQRGGTYYEDVRLLYAISRLDKRLPPKKRVLGLEDEGLFGAVQVDAVREQRVLNFSLGLRPLVAIYDPVLQAVRVFDRKLPGKADTPLLFEIFEDKIIDAQTKSEWSVEGHCSYGRYRETALEPMLAIDAMWYAWAAFHQGTDVYPPPKP